MPSQPSWHACRKISLCGKGVVTVGEGMPARWHLDKT
jgi:hypothetical protein